MFSDLNVFGYLKKYFEIINFSIYIFKFRRFEKQQIFNLCTKKKHKTPDAFPCQAAKTQRDVIISIKNSGQIRRRD